MAAMDLFHGANGKFNLHIGQDFTDSVAAAAFYAGADGEVGVIEIDLDSLDVVEATDYNPNTDPDEAFDGADVIIYEDTTDTGRPLTAYRLMTEAAIARATVVETLEPEEFEEVYL